MFPSFQDSNSKGLQNCLTASSNSLNGEELGNEISYITNASSTKEQPEKNHGAYILAGDLSKFQSYSHAVNCVSAVSLTSLLVKTRLKT
jgi:hypothetical protein